jgi:hypothetical protein
MENFIKILAQFVGLTLLVIIGCVCLFNALAYLGGEDVAVLVIGVCLAVYINVAGSLLRSRKPEQTTPPQTNTTDSINVSLDWKQSD